MINKKRLVLLLAAALLTTHIGVTNAQPAPVAETQMIEVLKSGAAFKEKQDACRVLAVRGTKDAVPALAALLGDEKLSHMARYALEQINDPSGTTALREALGTVKGLPLIGVISSVGAMRDTTTIPTLTQFLNGADADVADAAAHALGRIGTAASGKALMAALAKPTTAVYDGLLRCAETLPRKDAAVIYDAIRKPPAPQPIRMAALRSAIVARQEQGLPLLLESVRGTDYALTLAAMKAAREVPGAAVTKALAAELGKADADHRLLLVQVLGDRRDAVAGPQLLATAKQSDGNLLAATVKSIVQIGDAGSLPFLAEVAASDDAEVSKAARAGLVGFAGREAEAPIIGMLQSPNAKTRVAAAEIATQRRMTAAVPQLLLTANDADATVATASIRAIGEVGGSAEAPALIKILTAGASMPAAESALTAIYSRNHEASVTTALSAAVPNASPAAKLGLMRVLRRVGGPQALAVIRTEMAGTNPEVRENAMRNVGDWPTVDAVPDLLAMAKMPASPTIKILALRGLLRLIPLQEVTPDQKLTSVKEALALVERPEEKRLALAALGGIPTAESLALVMPELANPALRAEASLAAVAIGEQLAKTQPAVVSEAMAVVVKSTEDKQVVQRAQALIKAP